MYRTLRNQMVRWKHLIIALMIGSIVNGSCLSMTHAGGTRAAPAPDEVMTQADLQTCMGQVVAMQNKMDEVHWRIDKVWLITGYQMARLDKVDEQQLMLDAGIKNLCNGDESLEARVKKCVEKKICVRDLSEQNAKDLTLIASEMACLNRELCCLSSALCCLEGAIIRGKIFAFLVGVGVGVGIGIGIGGGVPGLAVLSASPF